MKLAFFDDFKLGVVKGDAIHDVSAVVRENAHVPVVGSNCSSNEELSVAS